MSRGHAPQAATLSGRRARCGKQRPAPRRVVLIDVDSAADSDVYIIGDDGEFHRASTFCAGKGNSLCSNVINIDDDDEEEGGRAGPSSAGNGRYLEATMPRHGFPRNRYGLDYISDSFESDKSEEGSDGDNGSDCEILDDTLGTVRKLWEKAASRKRMPGGLHARKDSRASTSTSSAESRTQPLENMENVFNTECHLSDTIWEYFKDVPREGTPNSSCGAKDGSCSVPNACKRPKDDVSSGKETEDSNATSNLDPTMDHNNETAPCQEGMIPQKTLEGSQSPEFNEYTFKGSYFCQPTGQEDTGARFKMSAPVFEENVACESLKTEAGMSSSFICTRKALPGYSWADRKGEGPPVSASFFGKMDDKIPEGKHCQMDQTTQNAHDRIGKQHKEMCFTPGDPLVSSQGTDEPHCNSRCCCLKQYEENCPHVQVKSCSMNAVTDEDASVNVKSMNKPLSPKDLVHSPEKLGQSTIDQDGQDFQNDLIGAREKHKESYEYKRAAEEEWASRQRQLQIQAEEAQRMRRRRKAETLRLLDMERRQKQRLEEVRESQRKNEEDIHLKEQFRVVVRKELDNMEKRYSDMASLLQGLGIPVEGGEVKAAYKQALLKFHPDRVSRSDIHQQVKAEETFKFISRLKEKLLPVA